MSEVPQFRFPHYEYTPAQRTPGESFLTIPTDKLNIFDLYKFYKALNPLLISKGILPLNKKHERKIVISNLDKKYGPFDPLRACYDPLNEYKLGDDNDAQSIAVNAAGHFGVQGKFWWNLLQGLTGRDVDPSQALTFSFLPVFKYQNQYYFLIKEIEKNHGVVTINYMGDADAISRAEKQMVQSDRGDYEGRYLGLTPDFFEKYLKLRRNINIVESNSLKKAFIDLVDNQEITPLYQYFPKDQLIRLFESIPSYTKLIQMVTELHKNMGTDQISHLHNQIAVEVFDYIIPFLFKHYDHHLRKNQYIETIGELSELMDHYYINIAKDFA